MYLLGEGDRAAVTAFKMPERLPEDGPVGVRREGDRHLCLYAEGLGSLTVSEYNAARLFGILAMFLEIRLPKALGKAIVLTEPGVETKMELEFPEPKTLGDRLALALLPDRIGDFEKVPQLPPLDRAGMLDIIRNGEVTCRASGLFEQANAWRLMGDAFEAGIELSGDCCCWDRGVFDVYGPQDEGEMPYLVELSPRLHPELDKRVFRRV
jgi:hypothetical protein